MPQHSKIPAYPPTKPFVMTPDGRTVQLLMSFQIAEPALQGEMVLCGPERTDFEKEGKMNGEADL